MKYVLRTLTVLAIIAGAFCLGYLAYLLYYVV